MRSEPFTVGELARFAPDRPGPVDRPPRLAMAPGGSSVAKRAAAYVAAMGGSVEGNHGDDHAFKVAAVLLNDFALPADEAWSILTGWNATACQPPWSERDLRRFIASAERNAKGTPGAKLSDDRPWTPPAATLTHSAPRRAGGTDTATAGVRPVPRSEDRTNAPDASLAALSIRLTDADRGHLENGIPHIATGWQRLDHALGGGFSVPSLNVLGAAPKSGKSTWAQIVAAKHAEAGGFVYYLDLENGRRRFLRQLLCRRAALGSREVARALRDERAGTFPTREAAAKWRTDVAWLNETLARGFLLETKPPQDFEARLRAVRAQAGDRRILVVIDSLQKLPLDLEDRRASIDKWIRFFEGLRHELDLVFLLISEIKRNGRGEYQAHEAAFKESGGIEYGADLAMTLTRPRADEDEEPVSTLRVELARDCDEDPRGDVASYAPVRPFYGLEEREPAERKGSGRRGHRSDKADAARDFVTARLADGPVLVSDLVRDGEAQGLSRSGLYRARDSLKVQTITVNLKNAWRLP